MSFGPLLQAAAPGAQDSAHCTAHDVKFYLDELRSSFGVEFSILHGETGGLLHSAATHPSEVATSCAELVRTVARHGTPEFVVDADGLLVLAIPVSLNDKRWLVAVAPFVTPDVGSGVNGSAAVAALGMDQRAAADWISQQPIWTAHALLQLAHAVLKKIKSDRAANDLESTVDDLTENLARMFEEISLLHRLTKNLSLTSSDEGLGRIALDWLMEVIPAKGVVIQYLPVADAEEVALGGRTKPELLTAGDCPLVDDDLLRLIQTLDLKPNTPPFVANANVTSLPSWQRPDIKQLVIVPLTEGENVFGWLAVMNHNQGNQFGTVEASLLSSVAAIMGIHSGNIELYRQQAEFLANVVRALTSAIDAKDPYTCGHSDRVARVSVLLAKELGLDGAILNIVYLSGLLHDIGKIGIEDNVLRKPGRLTESEYEHIKMHPGLGYKILSGLRQLDQVLPVVLHHHEQWDGNGYPQRLKGDQTPLLARICAVADAYDAMSSDRPYRRGMSDEKLDVILKRGAGLQWDPKIIEAFFTARDEIRDISRREREILDLNVQQWT